MGKVGSKNGGAPLASSVFRLYTGSKVYQWCLLVTILVVYMYINCTGQEASN